MVFLLDQKSIAGIINSFDIDIKLWIYVVKILGGGQR